MSNTSIKETIKKGVEEIFNKKNLAYIDEFIMPDIIDHSAPPGLPSGIEGYRLKLTMFTNAFPDLHLSYSHPHCRWRYDCWPFYSNRHPSR